MNMVSRQPWYKNPEYWFKKADDYVTATSRIRKDSAYFGEIESFSTLNSIRVIFESNLIEKAGLPEGETRKVILENWPQIPDDFNIFSKLYSGTDIINEIISDKKIRELIQQFNIARTESNKIYPSIIMKNKSRGQMEVLQHYMALNKAKLYSYMYIASMLYSWAEEDLRREGLSEEEVQSTLQAKTGIKKAIQQEDTNLFSEDRIKGLHLTLAYSLMSQDANVEAGEYRIDIRNVGSWEMIFPGPALIQSCMTSFISRANSILNDSLRGGVNKYEAAARISYEFVEIHPFPDFNGRLSRILMNMVLMTNFCPFPISLRGNSKEKHRYFIALKRANHGDIVSLASLIAMYVVRTFEELDRHFELAGLDSILKLK